jgi:MazG family protein
MAQERGWFDFAAVAQGIHDKLVRRHPHVFGGETLSGSQHTRSWEDLKAQERAQAARSGLNPDAGTLADVPKSLPALARAAKLGRRASRVGFDWDSAPGVRDKVLEELREVDDAVSGTDLVREGAAEAEGAAVAEARVAEEVGDLLFSVANWARHLRLDPEEALRKANAKFEMRFRRMEALATTRGTALDTLKPGDWEALWSEAKRAAESV